MSTQLKLEFVTVDVFTAKQYEGNPLAIVRIPHGASITQDQKQRIAREFNLSETTFLHENSDDAPSDTWTVDIFMTTRELPFAGHPTIGTACYVLSRAAEARGISQGIMEANFNLKAGPVGLQYDVAKRTARAAIPHDVHVHSKRWDRDELLGLQPQLAHAHKQGKVNVGPDFAIVSIVKGMTFVLVELESLEALDTITLAGSSLKIDGLDEGWDVTFVGTYFFVRTGKNQGGTVSLRTRMIEGPLEDPATGSAASDLAAFLSLQEARPGETMRYEITQGVEMGRRSEISVDVEMAKDQGISNIFLGGGAVQVMEGGLAV